jgi:hypothetical protein
VCPLASALQTGGPTASGDSDKSRSEVNDEDEEVRAEPPPCSLPGVHSAAFFTSSLHHNLTDLSSETCFAG